jgi:arylsulfatase A-like enzyme
MRRPNILIFMTDQQQADVVRPGHPCLTPNAERLAREGVTFQRAYCPTAHCCPSRASFFTGLYPSRHGIFNNISTPTALSRSLTPGVRLFSEGLREAGYQMAFSGKWHVSDTENPADRGWEELVVTAPKGSFMHRSPEQWRDIGAGDSDVVRAPGSIKRPGWGDFRLYGSYPDRGPKGYEGTSDARVVTAAVEALPGLAASGEPWCLYVGPLGPHDPFVVPEWFLRMYDGVEIPLPPSYADTLEDKPRVYRRMRRQYWDQLTPDDVRESIRHYWAYCTMMDTLLGETLDALDATGQADDTLVLVLSDHGEYAGAHGLYCKGVPAFREAYQVPCIARWPRGIAAPGRSEASFVTLADWAPTFLQLAGAPAPEGLTGRSVVPFLTGTSPADWPDEVHTQMNGVELYYSQRSVTTDRWKYVYNGFDDDELYDLAADPHETVNLADRPEHDDAKRDLVRRMWRFAAREGDDRLFNPYATVALAPWGPADAL